MYHTIVLVGFLGRDPEQRYTSSGQAVTNFSLATTERYRSSDGEQVEKTAWWRVTCWGKLAEIVSQYLQKGAGVIVEGTINPDPGTGSPKVWQKQDGSFAASYEITAKTVKFLPRSGGNGGSHAAEETLPAGEEAF